WYWLRGKVPQYFDEFIKSNGIAGTAFFPPGPTSQAPLAITAPISPSTSRGVKQTKKIEPKTNTTTAQTPQPPQTPPQGFRPLSQQGSRSHPPTPNWTVIPQESRSQTPQYAQSSTQIGSRSTTPQGLRNLFAQPP